uniref:DnaJ homologue subfamily C GRV2/DNAJC13 N-terminal domain-containing protein n=1 Tax=Globisporangium ultimum (strain ATCC 200006 / CBS 805.95 / DAOM BR144) TaxID=431595 RepID=K3WRG4_GLOUD
MHSSRRERSIDMRRIVARFMVHKVGSFVVKERVLCFGEYGFCTYDLDNKQITNTWPYEDVDAANVVEGESDFIIYTPRHRVKKTIYRCHFRMEVLVCLMRLRSLHQAKSPGQPIRPELQTYAFQSLKYHKRGVKSPCVIEVRPDGIYQKDSDGELMSHIPYTSLVSIDLICDDHQAICLNHSDNSSLFMVPKRTDLAQAIQRVMKAYGIQVNEYRKKTLEAACKDETGATLGEGMSFQYQVQKISLESNHSTPRLLSVSEKFITESVDPQTVISSRPLSRIYSLILFRDSPLSFQVVYIDGIRRTYSCEHNEKIVCELLASCHALGNHQVDVVTTVHPEWMRMLPRKIIQNEGGNLVSTNGKELTVMDRELRVVQASILGLLATHGYGKTVRVQRQLPKGLDEEMHSLALELNVNTPTPGVIAQPNKPFEKAVYVVAREMHDVVSRHGPGHEFIGTYLQTLYRLLQAPSAMKEFVRILVERGDEYIGTITQILSCRNPVPTYWMLRVLHRLIESKTHQTQCIEVLLSSNIFQQKLLALFDEDALTLKYLSELPTMMLSQLVLSLVKTNVAKHEKLSLNFYQNLATKYRMLQRILFGFPSLITVESCVGLLSRMTNNPYFAQFGGSHLGSSRRQQVPHHSLTFGENMNYGISSNRGNNVLSGRQNGILSRRNSYNSIRRNSLTSISSNGSTNGGGGGGVAVQNPEVLLRQYRLFIESSCGSLKKKSDEYDDPVFLRLRYRCRNVFLQELMSHMLGNFDDFKRVYHVECYQFSGILSTSNGQREKCDFYLTPRALIIVRVMNRQTHEYEFRSIEEITTASGAPDSFVLSIKKKMKYLISEQSKVIIQKIKDLAGAIGIHISSVTCDQLPQQQMRRLIDQDSLDSFTWLDVQKRTSRYGSSRYRRKKVCIVDGNIREVDSTSEKVYPLNSLRRVVTPRREIESMEAIVALDFSDGSRVVYALSDPDAFLGVLYDGYRFANNWGVSLGCEFSKINVRMTPRALLLDDQERFYYLNHEGLYIPAHGELTKEIENSKDDGLAVPDKIMFALENMNMNVRADDFSGKAQQSRVSQLSFGSIMRGMTKLLEQSSKPPVRVNEVAIVLDAFCRINDGCYKLGSDQSSDTAAIISILAKLLQSGESIPILWAVTALHSIIVDHSRLPANKAAEKKNRHQSTDNNHFDAIIKALSSQFSLLMELSRQHVNTGLTVAAISILKLVLEHGDSKVRQRICDGALETGQTVQDVYKAFFHSSKEGREVYQYIGSIWILHHKASYEMLVRGLPCGFLRMISHPLTRKKLQKEQDRQLKTDMKYKSPRTKKGTTISNFSNWFIKRMQQHIASVQPESSGNIVKVKEDNSRMNYPGESPSDLALLSNLVHKDFMLPDLIWNAEARAELKTALESAIESFDKWKANIQAVPSSQQSAGLTRKTAIEPKWNHKQFRVEYECLTKEPRAGRFYLRVILEKIKDGSLQFDEVVDGLETVGSNGHATRKKIPKESADLFYASAEIAKSPLVFFNEVYQCWLENLHLGSLVHYGAFGAPGSLSDVSEYWPKSNDSEESCYWMLKILIEIARVFPSVRGVSRNRAKFLVQLLNNSFVAAEIQDIVELMFQMSFANEATEQFCSKRNVQLFLFLATLCHRRKLLDPSASKAGDESVPVTDEDIPLMELNDDNTSSLHIAGMSFAGNSRFNLKWSAKHIIGNSETDAAIGGPFTVVELKEYLEKDATSRRQNSFGVYLCCCSKHTEHPGSHTWNTLAEFPELRWMELPDQSIDLYETTTYSLGILRNFVFNEKIVSSTAANVWPLPLANSVLSDASSVAMLAQLLLVEDAVVRKLVCEILMTLSDSILEKLYSFGTFFFIFAADAVCKNDEEKSFVYEAKLMKKIHRMQKSEERYIGQSYLLDLLPESLITILDTDSAESFADIYTCRKSDKRVLWSATMRQHLQLMIQEHIEDFKEELERDVGATYHYVPIPPVTYSELSHDVYCSGYYLSTLIESEAEIDAIEQPLILMGSIEEKWRYLIRRQARGLDSLDDSGAFKVFCWSEDMVYNLADLRARYRELCTKNVEVTTVRSAFDTLSGRLERKDEMDLGRTADEVIDCILKAQLMLLEKFKFQFFSFESKTLDLLINLLAPPLDSDGVQVQKDAPDFQEISRKILLELLSSAPKNVALLLRVDDFWEIFLDAIEYHAFSRNVEAKEDIFSILLFILSSDDGIRSLCDGFAGENQIPASPGSQFDFGTGEEDDDVSTFFTAAEYNSQGDMSRYKHAERIYVLVDRLMLSFENIQPWQLQKISFDIISALCRSRELQTQIVEMTRVFWKGLYLMLTSGEDSSAYRYGDTGVAQHKKERETLESAFLALRAIAVGLSGNSRSKALDALANLLPLDFLDYLERPNGREFCEMLFSEVREPTCIWNESMRFELMQLIEEYCTDTNSDELSFLESSINYMYDCLKDEPVVGGIFLSILLEKAQIDPDSITGVYLDAASARLFLEALFIFLNENRDPALGLYNDTQPALECLSVLADIPAFTTSFVECLEQHVDDLDPVNASISVATLGRYLLPFDKAAEQKGYSISSRRSLSAYGFNKKGNTDGLPVGMEAEFGNTEYLIRQELALLILNKICGFQCSLEKMLVPFCQFTWSLQVITDHLGYDQAYYALSCLAELCDTCLSIAEYVERSGLWVEVLGVALQSKQQVLHENFLRAEALRGPAFEILYALFEKDFSLRERMYSGLCRFLPYPVVYQIHLDHTKASKFFDDNHEKSDLIWNSHWRTEVRKKLDEIICRNRVERSLVKRDSVILNDTTDFVRYPDNFVAGLYLDRFLSRPDPEALTNPAHNLELLFQLWRTEWDTLVDFDAQKLPEELKVTVDEVERLTTAITYILRAPLNIDESIANSQIPDQIVKLVRHCNKYLVTSFPYRCVLRLARQLLQFPEMVSREFLELIICRITLQHSDIPALLKLVRRVLEARNAPPADGAAKTEPDYLLRDLRYYAEMVKFLETLVEDKQVTDAAVVSNANRVLRIVKSERSRDESFIASTFIERKSARWLNATLSEKKLSKKIPDSDNRSFANSMLGTQNGDNRSFANSMYGTQNGDEYYHQIPVSMQSFDVDGERDDINTFVGTFIVDDEREQESRRIQAPPKSINFDGEKVEVVDAFGPRSFRFKGNESNPSPLPSPRLLRTSTLRAKYEPEETNYHAGKAMEYGIDIDEIRAHRDSMPDMRVIEGLPPPPSKAYQPGTQNGDNVPMSSLGTPSEYNSDRRYSLLDSWKAPSTDRSTNSALSALTISKRGRRATALYSRIKSQKPKRWFNS